MAILPWILLIVSQNLFISGQDVSKCPDTVGESFNNGLLNQSMNVLLLTKYKFPCAGAIIAWSVDAWRPGNISLILARKQTDASYLIVGVNSFQIEFKGKNYFPVSSKERISFVEGDIIGVVSQTKHMLNADSNTNDEMLQLQYTGGITKGLSIYNQTFIIKGKVSVMAVVRGLKTTSHTLNDQESDSIFNREAKHCSFSDSIMGMPFNSWELPQLIGIRFPNFELTSKSELHSAHVQFTSARARDSPAAVSIKLFDTVNPSKDVVKQCQFQDKTKLSAVTIPWQIPAWSAGESGTSQATPNLVDMIKYMIKRKEWKLGNAIVFVFSPLSESGTREPYSTSAPGREPRIHLTSIDKITGQWQTWSPWSRCVESGDSGVTFRRRLCRDEKRLAWCPGKSLNFKTCNISSVLRWGEWSSWQPCSVSCEIGITTRNRTCNYYDDIVSDDRCGHGNSTSYTLCDTGVSCPVYNWTSWSQWGACSVTCKNGTSMRHRNCTTNGTRVDVSHCKSGNATDFTNCNYGDYCIDERGYNAWEPWSACSSTVCPEGKRIRQRFCINRTYCDRDLRTVEVCPPEPCPVDGAWGQWQPWLQCSHPCGGGRKPRYRYCDDPKTEHNGNPCPGPNATYSDCNMNVCPVNGGYSEWTSWSFCDQPCNIGKSVITRKCNNPFPKYGGNPCNGINIKSRKCNYNKCSAVTLVLTITLEEYVITDALMVKKSLNFNALEKKISISIRTFYINSSHIINNVELLRVRKSNKEVDIGLKYAYISSDQFLVLQHQIQSNRELPQLKAIYVSANSQTVPGPPQGLKTVATGSSSILCRWRTVKPPQSKDPVQGFILFYRKAAVTSGGWQRKAVPVTMLEGEIRDLDDYSTYSIRIAAFVKSGVGITSDLVYEKTLGGVPSSAPHNLTCKVWSSTEVLIEWEKIHDGEWNGFMQGYVYRYKIFGSTEWTENSVAASEATIAIRNLKKFTRYEFHVAATTKTGSGPDALVICKTQEDVPEIGPFDLKGVHLYSAKAIYFTWSTIPPHLIHGNLLGFGIAWGVSRIENKREESPTYTTLKVDPYTFNMEITGLNPNSEITVKVYGYTAVGKGKASTIVLDTCNCVSPLYVAWAPVKPFIDFQNGKLSGIFPTFIHKMLQSVCGSCLGYGDNQVNGSVLVYFDRTKDGDKPKIKTETELLDSISNNAHVHMPVFGKIESSSYLGSYHFIRVVQQQGYAMIVFDQTKRPQLGVIIASVFSLWPVALLALFMALLAGICVYLTDMSFNSEFPKGSYFKGALIGLWWAFVTMTTVGYGDVSPRSVLARIISIAWIQAGLILTGMIISVIASSLTLVSIPNDPKLYGSQVSVMNGTTEYYMSLRRNANVSTIDFKSPLDLIESVAKDLSQIALMDAVSASRLGSQITDKKLKISKLIEDLSGYGIVLSSDLVYVKENILQYCKGKRLFLQAELEKYTGKVEIPEVDKEQKSDLFNYKSNIFRNMAIALFVTFAVFVGLGHYYEVTLADVAKREASAYEKLGIYEHHFDASYSMERTFKRFTSRIFMTFEQLDHKHKQQMAKLLDKKLFYKVYLFRIYQNFIHRKIRPRRLSGIRPSSSQVIRELQSAELHYVDRSKIYETKSLSSGFQSS